MRIVMLILICWWFYTGSFAQTASSITDLNANTIGVNSLQGKKILLVVLPLQKDTGLINQLLHFQQKNALRVTVIGLVQSGSPSKESYKESYNDVSQKGVIVTEGLASTETVTNEREAVIQWVTTRSNNRQLDRYAMGSKYFLSEDGRLYAQLGKDISLDDRVVQNLVNMVVPRAVVSSPKKTPASTDALKDSTQSHF